MKIITVYIKNENFNAEIIQASGEYVHECIYIPSSYKANLMINAYDDWNIELDEDEIEFIINKIGDFQAYSITWKLDINLYEYVIDLSEKLDFVIDNDKGWKSSNTDIAEMDFNKFSNWIS